MKLTILLTFILLLASALLYGTFAHAEDSWCDRMETSLSGTTYNLTQLRQQLYLQQLNLGSYNPDQHTSLEYTELRKTYDTATENYNAIATSHNRSMRWRRELCND